mgnify:CR=1 FL=1
MIIREFMNLRVADPNGHMYKANWRDRWRWIKAGCPAQNEKALRRLCRMRMRRLARLRASRF